MAKTFFTTRKPPPESFATTAFFGVNAFFFTDQAGKSRAVRYRFVPEAGEHYLTEVELKGRPPSYLMDEIAPRVAKAPVRLGCYAQVGESGDAIDDPRSRAPEESVAPLLSQALPGVAGKTFSSPK